MCRKISASVDGGASGGSRVRRPRSEDSPSALAEIVFIIGNGNVIHNFHLLFEFLDQFFSSSEGSVVSKYLIPGFLQFRRPGNSIRTLMVKILRAEMKKTINNNPKES